MCMLLSLVTSVHICTQSNLKCMSDVHESTVVQRTGMASWQSDELAINWRRRYVYNYLESGNLQITAVRWAQLIQNKTKSNHNQSNYSCTMSAIDPKHNQVKPQPKQKNLTQQNTSTNHHHHQYHQIISRIKWSEDVNRTNNKSRLEYFLFWQVN